MSYRPFPIHPAQKRHLGVDSIPWELIWPHDDQATLNHDGQTLQVLARRGGLSYWEAIAILTDRRWHDVPQMNDMCCAEILRQMIDAHHDLLAAMEGAP